MLIISSVSEVKETLPDPIAIVPPLAVPDIISVEEGEVESSETIT